jgi:hypothetical protein
MSKCLSWALIFAIYNASEAFVMQKIIGSGALEGHPVEKLEFKPSSV